MRSVYLFVSVAVLIVTVFTGLVALGAMNHNAPGASGLCPFGALSGGNCPTNAFVSVNHHADIFQLLTQPIVNLAILLLIAIAGMISLVFNWRAFLLRPNEAYFANNFQIIDQVVISFQKFRVWLAIYTRGFPRLVKLRAR